MGRVDAGIDLVVPEELARLVGEEVDVVEHPQVRTGRRDHVERSDVPNSDVQVVVEGEVVIGPIYPLDGGGVNGE
jgi:hypothetical protein